MIKHTPPTLIRTHIMMLGWLTFYSLFWGTFGDQTHYRLSSLDPLTLDSFKTAECGDIVYGGRVIGRVGGNWSKYEVLSEGELLFLERGTLYHRFIAKSPAYDHPLAYDVACFTFDRLSRRPMWVDATSARLKGGPDDDGASARLLLPDCLDISASSSYPDTLLVLHANRTLTLNRRPILEGADELPAIFVIPSNSSSLVMGEVGQYTVILYSISISIVLIIRFMYSKQDRELLPLFHKNTGVYSMK